MKKLLYFFCGGLSYVLLELCWRGRSHWSMFLLGGICFLILTYLSQSRLSFLNQMLLGMGAITGLELAAGLLLNCVLGLGVWDYSTLPYHFMGQICLNYCLLWIPVSGAGLLGALGLRKIMGESPPPPFAGYDKKNIATILAERFCGDFYTVDTPLKSGWRPPRLPCFFVFSRGNGCRTKSDVLRWWYGVHPTGARA